MDSGVVWEGGERRSAKPDVLNNFNLLRLVFALMVAVYHAVLLPDLASWEQGAGPLSLLAELGVQGFFVLSGYLVYGSLERSSSLRLYAEKRLRRLYPAYAAVVIACAMFALLASAQARADLEGVGAYLGWNLAFANFMAPTLPGVFEANRFPEVNGALWTLKIEVMFYLILPVLAWLLRVSGRLWWVVLLACYIGAETWRIGLEHLGRAGGPDIWVELSRQLPGQMSFFATGIAFRILRLGRRPLHHAGAAGLVLLILSLASPLAEPLRAAGLGSVAIWFGLAAPRLFDAARFGDLSYGLYIVHFPIVQTIAALGLFASPAFGLGLASALSLAAALVLWTFVERPALRPDSAYRMH